jgi:hypothetical protein
LTETSPDYQWVAAIKFNPAATQIAAVLDKSFSQPLLMLIIDPSVGSLISQYTEPAPSNTGYIGPNSLDFDSLGNVYLAFEQASLFRTLKLSVASGTYPQATSYITQAK